MCQAAYYYMRLRIRLHASPHTTSRHVCPHTGMRHTDLKIKKRSKKQNARLSVTMLAAQSQAKEEKKATVLRNEAY